MIKISINCFAASISFYLRVRCTKTWPYHAKLYSVKIVSIFKMDSSRVLPEFQMVFLYFLTISWSIQFIWFRFHFFCSFSFQKNSADLLAEQIIINSQENQQKCPNYVYVVVVILVTHCWECQFLENVNKHASVLLLLLRSCPTTSKIRHFRITGWFCSTSNNSECDRRGQTAKFWKWVHQQNLFQATNICCGQEQLKNRKITAFPDSRQLLNTNKKRSASSCLLRPKDAKMPQAKLKTTAAAMTDCYKHWKKVKSQGFLLY